jgi:hypothetical protein
VTVRRGDTYPIYWQILDKGSPIDLTGATARLNVKGTKPVSAAQSLPATVEAAQKRVKHTLTGTLAPGEYAYEIETTAQDGSILTAPTKTNGVLIVLPDIA